MDRGGSSMNRRFWVILCLVVLVSISTSRTSYSATYETTIHVATTGTDADGCGEESNPCRTIQYAFDTTTGNILIKVAQGTYTGQGDNVVNLVLLTPGRNVEIVGGYTAANWATQSADSTATIIDGQNSRRGLRVYSLTGLDSNNNPSPPQKVTLRNITVQNGFINQQMPDIDWTAGGGIYCHNGNANGRISMELDHVTIRNNTVVGQASNGIAMGGGASFLVDCPAAIWNVVFEKNRVIGGNAPDGTRGQQAVGGGFYSGNSSHIFGDNITFRDNSVTGGSGGSGRTSDHERSDGLGGAASFQFNQVTLTNITAIGNNSKGGSDATEAGSGIGGAFFFERSNGSIIGAHFEENHALGGSSAASGGLAFGGAIQFDTGVLTLKKATFRANTSIGGAGANSGNNAGGGDSGGGAISIMNFGQGETRVEGANLVFAANRAEAGAGQSRAGGGGAIFSLNGKVVISHATFDRNHVLNTMQGPAIIVQHWPEDRSGQLELEHSIVANHSHFDIFNNLRAPIIVQTKGDTGTIHRTLFFNSTKDRESATYVSQQPGLAPGSVTLSEIFEGDPKFVAPGSPNYDYHIGPGSAAMDRAIDSVVTDDIRQTVRPLGNAPDLGAYEFDERAYGPRIVLGAASHNRIIQLSWQADVHLLPDLDHFHIRYANTASEETARVEASATSYLLSGLVNYQPYTIVVEGWNASNTVLVSSNSITAFPSDIAVFLPWLSTQ
jgi:hypothetical protein